MTESPYLLKFIGAALIIVGILMATFPELVSNKPVPTDTFKAVERRIWWGLLIGIGLLLQFHHQLIPWQTTVSATLASLLVGLLIARLIGIALDGSVAKQWFNVGIELVLLAPLVWWYFSVRS
ncbi:DUF4345 family protein [Neiella marina]|uniref:DUF4345 family protein n=1 Tax=Neiella holothuriorum TaxID=2870530 RepID=A0ABS7ECI2_9GAMM|nr:DUF4345 family protein [Neiella holothuriorum]MBW8189668.1 DUF4345 family protein [Neiella holothuriorum]